MARPDAYTGESIYQHAHIYKRGFTSVRAPGIRLAVDGKARGRLVSAQLWRHPSHDHVLQGSRDQPPARPPRPHPAAANAQPTVARWLHPSGRICMRAYARARMSMMSRTRGRGRPAGLDHGSRPVASSSSSARASGLWPRPGASHPGEWVSVT